MKICSVYVCYAIFFLSYGKLSKYWSVFKKTDVTKIVIVFLVMNLGNLDDYFIILMVFLLMLLITRDGETQFFTDLL